MSVVTYRYKKTIEQARITYQDYAAYLQAFKDRLLERLGDELIALALYGSVARGKARPESDVDLLIILRDASSIYYERLKPILEVERALRMSPEAGTLRQEGLAPYLSYLVLSEEEARGNRYVFLDMIEEARILYDREGFFARRLQEFKERLAALGSQKVYLKNGSWYWDLKPDLVLGEVFEL